MNYIEQINNFWDKADEIELKSNEIAIYFALLRMNNQLGWIASFRCDWAIISQYAGVSKNTFYKCLESLQNHKLIKYEKGIRNCLKPKISILKIKNRKGTEKEQERNKKGTEKEQKGNLNKPINNKTNKPINNTLSTKVDATKDLHTDFIKLYNEFHVTQTSSKMSWPKTQAGKEAKAIKSIIAKCLKQVETQYPELVDLEKKKSSAKKIFEYVLVNWDLQKNNRNVLDNYTRSNINPSQINMNWSKILKAFKDATNNKTNSQSNTDTGVPTIREQSEAFLARYKASSIH